MGYIQNQLLPGEQVVCAAKSHWGVYVATILFCSIVIIASIIAYNINPEPAIVAFCVIFAILVLFIKVRIVKSNVLVITSMRVIGNAGIFKQDSLYAHLRKIDHVTLNKGFWGKVFGYGKIKVSTAGSTVTFNGMADPENFKKILFIEMEKNVNP